MRRFYNYISETKKKDVGKENWDAQDIRDYLTFLAVKQNVASSTRNQAFNAVLFFFRNVLNIEVFDLDKGYGEVYLPNALERKYPKAGSRWCWQYVFPSANLSIDPFSGKVRRHHIGAKTIQNAVKKAAEKAGIDKHVTVHTFRHSFATHLLMSGVNIREIQELLGHKNIETTMIYTHVLRDMSSTPKSPLDNLYASRGQKTKA